MSNEYPGNKGHVPETGNNDSLRRVIDERHADREKRAKENPWTPKEPKRVKGSWRDRQ